MLTSVQIRLMVRPHPLSVNFDNIYSWLLCQQLPIKIFDTNFSLEFLKLGEKNIFDNISKTYHIIDKHKLESDVYNKIKIVEFVT